MKFAFTTLGCPDWTVEQVAAAARKYGYDGVELRLIDGQVITPELIRAARPRIEQHLLGAGIAVSSLATSASFSTGDESRRQENVAAAAELAALAASLDCRLIRVFGGKCPDGVDLEAGASNVAAGLNALASEVERHGVIAMLETHDDFCDAGVVASIMARVPSPAIGVHWDIQNTFKMGADPARSWQLLGDRIVHVHIKDARRGDEPWTRVLLGEGDVPWQDALRVLVGHGYAGYLCVEFEKKWYPNQPDPDVALPQYSAGLQGFLATLGGA